MLYSTSPELILHNWNFIHMLHQLLTSWKPPFHSSPGFCESAVLDTACKLHRVAFVLCDCYYTQPSLGTVLKEKEMPHNVTIWWTLRGWFLRVAPADNHGTSLKVWPEKRDVVLRTDLGAPQRQQRCWAGGRQTALSLSPRWSCQRWEERKGKKRMHVVLRGKSQVGWPWCWHCPAMRIQACTSYVGYRMAGQVLCMTLSFNENHLNLLSLSF